MRALKRYVILVIVCIVLGSSINGVMELGKPDIICAASKYTDGCKEYKLKEGDLNIREIFVNKMHQIMSYYVDEDGINKKAVYNDKKNRWSSDYVEDSYMDVKGEKKYYSIYPTDNGYIEAAPDFSKIVIRNPKGKKILIQKMNKVAGWKTDYRICNVKMADKNNLLFICQRKENGSFYMIYVDMKSKRVKWRKKGVSDEVYVIKNKLYSYSFKWKNIGNPSKRSDVLNVYRLKDGKKSSSIDATCIRNRIVQKKNEITEDAYPITDQRIRFSQYKGKMYAAYMSGIFVYDLRSKQWHVLVDGVNDRNYTLRENMTLIDLLVCSDKKFYLLATKGNDEGEATDFIKYEVN